MTKKRKNVFGFDQIVTKEDNTNTDTENVAGKRNTNKKTSDLTEKNKPGTDPAEESRPPTSEPDHTEDSEPGFLDKFQARFSRPTIEDTHTRRTFLVRNDLLKRMDRMARKQRKGFKTHLLNHALEKVLDELEKDKGK